jgi:hypothetical protein
MGMTPPAAAHSAAGPALGYIYQFQAALLELIPHALSGRDAQATLEVFDDVAFDFEAGQAKSVLQIHHSLRSDRELLDTSAKTWRTLAIWAGEWARLDAGETRMMTLLSTQRARAGSGLQALTIAHRNVDHAFDALTNVAAAADGSASTATDREAFLALPAMEQRALLENVTVADGALQATESRARLVQLLAPTHERRFIESMADAVEGWWWPPGATSADRTVPAVPTRDRLAIRADEVRVAWPQRSPAVVGPRAADPAPQSTKRAAH